MTLFSSNLSSWKFSFLSILDVVCYLEILVKFILVTEILILVF